MIIIENRTVPCSPRSKNYAKGTVVNVSGGSTSSTIVAGSDVDIVKTTDAKELTNQNVLSSLRSLDEADKKVLARIIGVESEEELTDDKALSALRVLAEIAENNESLKAMFLRKDVADAAQGLITFLQGARYGSWSQGSTGAAIYQDEDGNWHFEADFMNIRKKITATEIEIMEASHIGGVLELTGASMKCIKVEETADAYRCFMRLEDSDGNRVYNQWKVGDQAFVETFNLTRQADGKLGNHYLWRLVTAVGEDYIDLSKTIAGVGSDAPLAGDKIVLLGYQGSDDPDRQNAMILAGAGVGSPSLKEYTGINSFFLPEEETRLKPGDNKVTGVLHIQPGSTGYDNIEGLTDKFNSLVTGAVNLLLNTGFTGDYQPIPISQDTIIMNDTQLYSEQTKNWTVSGVTIKEDIYSASGYSAVIGLLAQTVSLTDGENYILSFKAKGTTLSAVCGSLNETVPVTAEYQRFIFKFTAAQAVSVVFNGTATICEIMLERGVIASEWRKSYLDNDKSFAEFKAYQYLMSSIRNGSTDVIGGLILTNMLQVGNYKDGVLEKVTGGKSGVYNDDNDVSDWGGGTYQQAVYTVMKYLDDPTYQPTEEELAMMCKWVATHGGRFILNDSIVRGTVYADSGVFRGRVYAEDGEFTGTVHATDGSFSGTLNGITGSFKSLNCVNDDGVVVATIKFGSDGRMWFENGDLYHQGTKDGRSLRFYQSTTWIRGAFGALNRTIMHLNGATASIYMDGTSKSPDTITLTPKTDSNSNTYYDVDMYSPSDLSSGMPVDVVVMNGIDYRYNFLLAETQRVLLINSNDDHPNYIYSNGAIISIEGGSVGEIVRVSDFLSPTINTNLLGHGILLGGRYDNNW